MKQITVRQKVFNKAKRKNSKNMCGYEYIVLTGVSAFALSGQAQTATPDKIPI